MRDQKKAGALFSYFNIALNMFISVFFTPFLISSLGDAEYGLYRVVQSFAGQLVVMTFGMSTLVTRNIVYYDELKQKKEKENFLAMALIISVVLIAIVLIIGGVMYAFIDNIFAKSFTIYELQTAKKLFVIFILNVAATILNDYFHGMLSGHEQFAVGGLTRCFNRILRVIIMIILLKLGFKSVAIVATDLGLMVAMLIFNAYLGLVRLHEKIKFYYLDKAMLKTTLFFSSAILLQAIINQVNNNLDSFILGVMVDTKTVTMYSVALTIFSAYSSVTTVVVSIFAPHATRMVVNNATSDDLTNLVSRTGRYQFMLGGAVVAGFILFGKNFIRIWVGEAYIPAYIITVILIVPITIPLIESVSNSILDAKLKRMGRSVILCLMAVINIITSVILIKNFGYIGAAYGTALSVIVGHCILINLYLKRTIGLKIIKIFRDIFKGLLPCTLASMLISMPFALFLPDTVIMFIVKCTCFMLIYGFMIYRFGMNESEKNLIRKTINKINRRKV